jgi:formylglycine-generating enzyme required for sulfatase activity
MHAGNDVRRTVGFTFFPADGCARRALGAAVSLITVLPLCGAPALSVRTVEFAPAVAMSFVRLAPDAYLRGSHESEGGRDRDEGPQHDVTLSRSFWLGTHEVTQAQWTAVMGENPAVFRRGEDAPQRPVESISWGDGQRFIAKLGALGLGKFRLPTEAEWEFAARAGTTTRYPWGDDLKEVETHAHAWANSRSYAVTHPVGTKKPNGWGLFDMHGGVWEWCSDWYGPYADGAQRDPTGPASGRERVFRGGSWYDFPTSLRSANRHRHTPGGRYPAVGLRLVYVPEEKP